MSLLQDFYVNTGEIPRPDSTLPSAEIITRPITHDRPSFAVLGSSGEFPLGIRPPAPELADPADTLRISVPVTYGAPLCPPAPPGYRGVHRHDDRQARAALTAATGRAR